MNAPIAGLTVSADLLVWSHFDEGCVLSAPVSAFTAPYATLYAGSNSADGLQVFFLNNTVSAAWRYPPDAPTTVQLLSLESGSQPVRVAVVSAVSLEDFVYYEHIDKPYYRTVPGTYSQYTIF